MGGCLRILIVKTTPELKTAKSNEIIMIVVLKPLYSQIDKKLKALARHTMAKPKKKKNGSHNTFKMPAILYRC